VQPPRRPIASEDSGLVGRHWTPDLVAATRRLYEERERLFDAHDALPRTLIHGDTGRRNLFGRRRPDGTDETVLIDWGYCGIGAVGEDLHLMVVWTAQMFDVDVADLDELERLALTGYQAGLRDAGVALDPRLARLGYLVPAAVRNSFMPFGAVMPEPAQVDGIERAFGRPFEAWVARTIAVRRFMLERADQARQLIDELAAEGLLPA
jgi:Ser/Thr protein kinase RdoA (MazF antagonist)